MTQRSDEVKEDNLATNTVGPPRGALRELQPGDHLGRYLITGRLGQGGMGIVYSAVDSQLARSVAIKLLNLGKGDPTGRARLLREAQAMARVSHPNVLTVYEAAELEGLAFVAMEQIEGLTLRAWLKAQPRSWQAIIAVFAQAGRGLAAAHAAGIVHRDFKPDNVLIGVNGRVFVCDFGVARSLDPNRPAAEPALPPSPAASAGGPDMLHSPLTVEGQVVGTVAYMAPEQLANGPVDARTDQFSFCVALFEALHGERPFTTQGFALQRKPHRPATRAGRRLLKVIDRGLELAPDARYPTMETLLAEMEEAATRRWTTGLVAAVAVAALVGAAAWLLSGKQGLCASPAHALDQVWNEGGRRRIHAAFLATSVADAEVRWTYAERAIDCSAGAWRAAVAQVCDDASQHRQAASAVALRLECLERQRQDLSVFMEMLAKPSDELVSAATSALNSLDPPATCQDAHSLPVIEDLPPAQREVARRLRADVVRSVVLAESGQIRETVTLLQEGLKVASTIDAPPLVALLNFALGTKYQRLGQHELALRHFRESFRVADAAQLNVSAADSAASIVAELALGGATQAELDTAVADMNRAAARSHGSVRVEGYVEFALGVLYNSRGQTEQAAPHLLAALRATRKVEGDDTLNVLTTLNNLGACYDTLGRSGEALATYRDALALYQRVNGPSPKNMRLRLLWLNVGYTSADLHDYAAAKDALARSLLGTENVYTAIAIGLQAEVAASEGHTEQARGQLKKALALLQSLKVEESAEAMETQRRVAMAAALIGDRATAEQAAARSESLGQKLLQANSPDWVPFLVTFGTVAQLNGDQKLAAARLERALSLAAHDFFPGCLAELHYRLARALVDTHGDRARAADLAALAEAEFQKLPLRGAMLAEVSSWRSATFEGPHSKPH